MDKLQRVMNAAARVVSDTHKFDRGLTNIRRNDLHWFDVPERVTLRFCVMVYNSVYTTWHRRTCLNCAGRPATSKDAVNCALCDSRRPRCSKMSTINVGYGRRAFSYAGPPAWNSLPDRLKNSTSTIEQFRRLLKSFLFSSYSAWSALERFSYLCAI